MGQWWALLAGPLDADGFAAAWAAIVQRHAALRSGFHWELKGAPAQVVVSAPVFEVERLDWSARDDWRAALDTLLEEDRAHPFDLRRPPLMRVRLITVSPERAPEGPAPRHLLVWTRHHLAVDGWSLGEILGEVLTLYRGGTVPPALPFRRYVEWWQGRDDSAARVHWGAVLAGHSPESVARSSTVSAPRIGEAFRVLSPALADRLGALSRTERLTLSTLVEGAWALVLARTDGVDDLVMGCVETVRPPELLGDRSSAMVGPQIGVLPSRVRRDALPLRHWLAELQRARVAGREAGPLALDALRDLLGLPSDALPLRSLIAVQTYPLALAAAFRAAGLEIRASGDVTLPDMPLNLMVEIGEAFELRLMVDQQHVALPQARQLLDMLATALERLPDHLDAPANALNVMPEALDRQISAALTGRPLPAASGTALDLILAQMRARPEAPAIVATDRVWTYGDLGNRAAALAGRLAAAGVKSGARVAVKLEHGPEAVAAILGIVCAGASYVPLDPETPAERRAMIIEAAGVAALVTRRALAETVPGLPILTVDDIAPEPADLDAVVRPAAADEAYVIFTSGSTGRPKGVSVGHDNLRTHVAASAAENADLPIGRFLLTFPLFFDGSVTGLFCTLCEGGTLVMPDAAQARDADRLVALIREAAVTHVCLTPSLWALLLETSGPQGLPGLRLAKVAAEPCPPALVSAHAARAPNAVLCNEYGPTEATVWVCVERCRPETTGASVAIGHPLPGTRLHVMDGEGRPCPFGTIGELVVSGPAVARAYIGAEPGVVLRTVLPGADPAPAYRTGDRVSLGFDGRLFFHGRRDRQVKIAGYRVEPADVEAALQTLPGILDVAVVVEESEGRPARLVAHLGGADLPDDATLRRLLAARLPAYMIPHAFFRHARLPRTANGKVDRAALPPAPVVDSAEAPPQGTLETALAALWSEALGGARVGRHDHFFALGGSSLLAMQMIARVRRELAPTATLADLFEAPQLAGLAERLAERMVGADTRPEPGPILAGRQRARVELPS
ncbi:amino acid adenylation domain-containing protein [Ancylobacter aquaticus]|uniref:Amino acid adenylation domain-containing protein n=2 Tax=Ancylobacter aquaticus TaxID=100 RepID=A0A4R1HM24_ANCAQ|nr:amino acid adenylation domain-containing protein [Ancylobacter aquaticus]